MTVFSEFTTKTLHSITSVMQTPVVILIILLMAFGVFTVGWVIAEYFSENRHMKVQLPKLLDEIRSEEEPMEDVIKKSKLLKSQKKAVVEITKHPELTTHMRDSLTTSLIEKEEAYYNRKIKITDLMAKLGPMLGLMGTLIPLGPGIIALGQGDTYTLAQSLMTAFDTTIAGMMVAAVAIVVSTIRKGWYNKYMSNLEAVMECVLEMENRKEQVNYEKEK